MVVQWWADMWFESRHQLSTCWSVLGQIYMYFFFLLQIFPSYIFKLNILNTRQETNWDCAFPGNEVCILGFHLWGKARVLLQEPRDSFWIKNTHVAAVDSQTGEAAGVSQEPNVKHNMQTKLPQMKLNQTNSAESALTVLPQTASTRTFNNKHPKQI